MEKQEIKIKYVCPMNCQEPQDEPGNCAVCGMKLVEKKEKINHQDNKKLSKQLDYDKHSGHNAQMFIKKFWVCLILTLPVIFYSNFFQKIVGIEFKLPAIDYLILILGSIVFFYGGSIFLIGAIREIKAKIPGMMTLIALAITSSYTYSVFAVTLKIGSEFFWELTSLITIMLLGHYFEMKSVSSAQKSFQEIEKLLPDTAELINGKKVKIEELKVGDLVLIKPGEKIPADGIIVEGKSEINESMITGESKPVLKMAGLEVIAGTINGDGLLKIKVTKIGEETFLAGIKRLIKEAQSSKSKLQILADIFAKYLTFVAIFVGSLSFIIWFLVQKNFFFALERLVTVLIIACPHALGLAVPLVVAISTSLAIHNGFLIKNRLQLELARKVNIILFDKTGTLTKGEFEIKKIWTPQNQNQDEILKLAGSLESFSEHLIAKAIVNKAKEKKLTLFEVKNFQRIPGVGAQGNIGGKFYYIGNEEIVKNLKISQDAQRFVGEELKNGRTVIYLKDNEKILGIFSLADVIRQESLAAIKELKNLGYQTWMITGDNDEVAKNVSKELNLDNYFADIKPEDKVNKVKELQGRGFKVMMVGDGINDAPALMQADVGVAIGAGTNIAIESAGIILIQNNPKDIVKIIKLSMKTYQKMIENLFWATGYNIFAIPLAAGILAFKGVFLSPALGAVFMSLSTIIVAFNALKLKNL